MQVFNIISVMLFATTCSVYGAPATPGFQARSLLARHIHPRGLQGITSGLEFNSKGSAVYVEAVEIQDAVTPPPAGVIYPAAAGITQQMDARTGTAVTLTGRYQYQDVLFAWEVDASYGTGNARQAIQIVNPTNLAAIMADTIDTMVIDDVGAVRFEVYGQYNGHMSFLALITITHLGN